MSLKRTLAAVLFFAVVLGPVQLAFADDHLQSTLAKLDQAAARFKCTSADFKFATEQTIPIPDKEVLEGTAYYERTGKDFQMAAHIAKDNDQPAPKMYTFTKGQFKLYEPATHQITLLNRANKFADYIMLGFGASGKQLADKWDITDLGPETIDGVQTEKLELVAKDPTVKKNLPQVTVWMDLNRAISLKQIFDEGQGQTRTCTYTNIKTPQSLPAGVFEINDSQAHTVTR
jgi:outer membrane lipoprotein-sorting protein